MQHAGHLEVQFLRSTAIAVVGASTDPSKFGNIIVAHYLSKGVNVVPVTPRAPTPIHEVPSKASITEVLHANDALRAEQLGVSVCVPPAVSMKVVEECAGLGVRNVW